MKETFKIHLHNKIIVPIKQQLSQGYTSEKISMSIVVGLVLGCCPVFGLSTLAGFIIATIFSLNHIVLQTINYAVSPLHLALLLPFWLLGQKVFSSKVIPLKPSRMLEDFNQSPVDFLKVYGWIVLQGLGLWLLLLPLAIPILYFTIRPLVARLGRVVKSH